MTKIHNRYRGNTINKIIQGQHIFSYHSPSFQNLSQSSRYLGGFLFPARRLSLAKFPGVTDGELKFSVDVDTKVEVKETWVEEGKEQILSSISSRELFSTIFPLGVKWRFKIVISFPSDILTYENSGLLFNSSTSPTIGLGTCFFNSIGSVSVKH